MNISREKMEYLGIENLGFCKHDKECGQEQQQSHWHSLKIDQLKLSIDMDMSAKISITSRCGLDSVQKFNPELGLRTISS